MEAEATQLIVEALKDEKVSLFVTLPEEPTAALTRAIQADPYFTCVTVAAEDGGIALCAGASIGGRRCVFVTGIAGLLKGALALAHMGPQYGIPLLILASYRGDVSDRSRISGGKLATFGQVGEPLLQALRVTYRVVDERRKLKRMVRDAHRSCRQYGMPVVLLRTGEVLW